jgi:hypothetical protein
MVGAKRAVSHILHKSDLRIVEKGTWGRRALTAGHTMRNTADQSCSACDTECRSCVHLLSSVGRSDLLCTKKLIALQGDWWYGYTFRLSWTSGYGIPFPVSRYCCKLVPMKYSQPDGRPHNLAIPDSLCVQHRRRVWCCAGVSVNVMVVPSHALVFCIFDLVHVHVTVRVAGFCSISSLTTQP